MVGFPLDVEEEHPLDCGKEDRRPNAGEAFGAFGNPAAARAKDSLGSETKARPVFGGELAVRRDDAAEVRLLAAEVPSPQRGLGEAERTRLERHRHDANLDAAHHSYFVLPPFLVVVEPASLVELCTAPPDAAAKISPLGVGA